jgi:hypothetical protein
MGLLFGKIPDFWGTNRKTYRKKKPKGKELTDEQKKSNQSIASFRILVEHAIGGVKKCRIVKDRIRCYKLGFEDLVMLLACGLHNLRMSLKMCCVRI